MKIMAKLLIGFLAVALICGVVGVIGISQLSSLNGTIRDLSGNSLPTIIALSDIMTNLERLKMAIRTYANPLGAEDEEFLKRQVGNIEKYRKAYNDAITEFNKTSNTAEEQALWDAFSAEVAKAKEYNDSVIALVQKAVAASPVAGAPGELSPRDNYYRQAYDLISGEKRLAFDNMVNALDKVQVFDEKHYGVDLPKAAVAAGNTALTIVIIVTVLGFLVAIVLGVLLGRSISNSLKKTVVLLDKIAKGDLSEKMVVTSKDEFKNVADSLNKVEDNVSALVADANMLSKAAIEGKLATRADASKHEGDYRKIVQGVDDCLDAVIKPLNVAANYVDRISKGDIPPKITDSYNGDFNEIKNNLNQCVDAVNLLVADAAMLAKAAVEGKLATRADAKKHQGDFAKIVQGVDDCLDAVIKPLNVAANYVDRISKGDIPPKITDSYNGDFNEIKNNLNQCVDALQGLIQEMNHMSKEHDAGDIDVKIEEAKFIGAYKVMAEGVNTMVFGHIAVKKKAMACVAEFSKGNFEAPLEKFPGKKAFINDNMEMLRTNLKALIADANMLSMAAVEGKLTTRADATKHLGDFRRIVDGVNKTLDAVIGPLNVTAKYVDDISKGVIPPIITDNYNGDFNVIKGNLNTVVKMMSDLLKETDVIIKAAANGELDKRANADLFQGGWNQLVAGVNDTIKNIVDPLMVTADYVDKVAKGIIPPQITTVYLGQYNIIKTNLNSVVKMMSELLSETDIIIKAAADGQLETRADASKFVGGWNKLVSGVNDTITNIVNPLNVTADYVEKVSKGVIPPVITTEYRGQYNVIKGNLNTMVGMMSDLLTETDNLVQAAIGGQLTTRANATKFAGGWFKLVDGVNKTLDAVIGPINETIEVLKHLADGNLTQTMTGDYKGDFNILKTALNDSLDSIGDTLGQVNVAVDQVTAGSGQVSMASQSLSQGATEQASSLEEITSSITEISSQTRQNTESAIQVNGLAKGARDNAEQGNVQMKDLVAAMTDINKSAEEIRKIVKAIDDISFQINLLALNANVEAARAGKYGKGFAVVAEEVRNLAVRSANSVKETNSMVEEAINNIARGNSLVEVTAKQLAEIVGGASKVADLAEEVATASKEQSQGLEQISTGLNQIDQVTQSNTASAEESASAAEELSSQAQQLKAMLTKFKLKIAKDRGANAEMLAMLRNEMARQDTHKAAGGQARGAGAGPKPEGDAKKKPAMAHAGNPRDLISLDDDNFGKF